MSYFFLVMKHSVSITLILIASFVLAQVLGVFIIEQYVDVNKSLEMGTTEFQDLPTVGGVELERPDVEESTSFIYVVGAILVGTILLLILIRYAKVWVWKAWFFFAVAISLYIAFAAFVSPVLAGLLAVTFGVVKLMPPDMLWKVISHNVSELFIYGGLAAIFVPIFDLWAVSALLLLLSLYDMYAVWKSKHMVTMAKFQVDSGVFAGLSIPYKIAKVATSSKKTKKSKAKKAKKVKKSKGVPVAFLGGGDIALPLLFTGTVFKVMGLGSALLIIPFTTAALALLLFLAKKDRFYPAMPFISGGAFAGLGVVWLLTTLSIL
jgi:presenilin-like A22 family membrane protease